MNPIKLCYTRPIQNLIGSLGHEKSYSNASPHFANRVTSRVGFHSWLPLRSRRLTISPLINVVDSSGSRFMLLLEPLLLIIVNEVSILSIKRYRRNFSLTEAPMILC